MPGYASPVFWNAYAEAIVYAQTNSYTCLKPHEMLSKRPLLPRRIARVASYRSNYYFFKYPNYCSGRMSVLTTRSTRFDIFDNLYLTTWNRPPDKNTCIWTFLWPPWWVMASNVDKLRGLWNFTQSFAIHQTFSYCRFSKIFFIALMKTNDNMPH